MNPAHTRVFWADPFNPRTLEVGTMLKVELDQKVDMGGGHYDNPGPHVVGQAEVVKGGVLKLSLETVTAAGRHAAAMVEAGITDVVLHGSKPIVRLTQAPQ